MAAIFPYFRPTKENDQDCYLLYFRVKCRKKEDNSRVDFAFNTKLKIDQRYLEKDGKSLRKYSVGGAGIKGEAGLKEANDTYKKKEKLINNAVSELYEKFGEVYIDEIKRYFSPQTESERLEKIVKAENSKLKDYILNRSTEVRNKGTRRAYTNILFQLKAYELKYKVVLDYDSMTEPFLKKFIAFLADHEEKWIVPMQPGTKKKSDKKKLSDSTIMKYIGTIRTILREAERLGYTSHRMPANFHYRPSKMIETQSIYLTIEEIEKIYALDLTNRPGLERVRDAFVLGCYTGQRFSDYIKFHPRQLSKLGDHLIWNVAQKKTGTPVKVPLNSTAREIASRYPDGFKQVRDQVVNRYLKVIGEMAGITQEVMVSKKIDGDVVSEMVKKYELIGTHTARRSYATNAIKQGASSRTIMKISGHKTDGSFAKYVRTEEEEAIEEISKLAMMK